ncbi:hypothetical protein DRH14_01620 [Candidatus Shapirobacteria bacterium]|nr:MAG: hypothetical protein DRH14_01620 [Candidatus Shapirobacteria bacterium]
MKLYFLPPLVGAIFFIFICLFVFLKCRRSPLVFSFELCCVSVILWLGSYTVAYIVNNSTIGTIFSHIACISAMFTAPTFYHFAVNFLKVNTPKERALIKLFYLIMFLFMPFFLFTDLFLNGSYKYFFGYYSKAAVLHPFYLLIFFAIYLRGVWLLGYNFYLYNKKKVYEGNPLEGIRMKYVLIAYFVALIGAIDYIPKYGIEFYPFGFSFEICFVLIITYAIVRYRLMDIYILLRKTVVYGILTGFMVGVVALITFCGQQYFEKLFATRQWLLSLVSVLLITAIFRPLQISLQRFADRHIFHQHYEYREVLKEASKDLSRVKNLRSLLVMATKVISDTLIPDHIAIFIKNKKKNYFDIKISRGKRKITTKRIGGNNCLIQWLLREGKPVVYEELKYRLQTENFAYRREEQRRMEELVDEMEKLNANVCIPAFLKKELQGGLILGARASGDMYTQEDLDLLQSLANHTATVINNLQIQQEKDELTVDAIAALVKATEAKDPYTSGHSERVTKYAEEIVEKLKDTPSFRNVFELQEKVHYAGLMHDVGKVGIPDSILHKPGKLTEEEFRIIKEHPVKSAEIISQIRDMDREVIKGILHHHERWDGRGYPSGLAGQEIPKIARILAVADAYDAMTTDRAYRPAFPPEQAYKELRKESGRQFDPQVVEAFLKGREKQDKRNKD